MEHKSRVMEDGFKEGPQRLCHLLELGEHENPFPFLINGFTDAAQAHKFSAVGLLEIPGACDLVRVIAQLFKPEKKGEHQSFSLDALGGFNGLL